MHGILNDNGNECCYCYISPYKKQTKNIYIHLEKSTIQVSKVFNVSSF